MSAADERGTEAWPKPDARGDRGTYRPSWYTSFRRKKPHGWSD